MTKTTDTPADAPLDAAAAEMTSYDMAASILVGLYAARKRAKEEFEAAFRAGGGAPMAPGTGKALALRNTLDDAIRRFERDLHQISRSNNLTMPEVDRT